LNTYQEYISNVLSGKRLSGRLERLSVERQVRLMGDDRYYFDEDKVNRVLQIAGLCRHTKGSFYGKRFELFGFQAFLLSQIFGLIRKDTEKRLIRKVLYVTAKKSGKSEFAGLIGQLFTFFDGESGAECYSAANKFDQALFCWQAGKTIGKQLAQDSELFSNRFKLYDSINNRSIYDLETDSFFKPIAADAKTLDGVNPHLAIIDEYHEAKDSSVPDNMSSGMVLRDQPLLLYVTTRGFNVRGPLWQLENVAIDILEGKKTDDSFFPLIFSLDKDDDWHNRDLWVKANPGIGRAPSWAGIEAEYDKAVNYGATAEVNFKTKNLNIWVRQSKTWITDKIWMKGNKEIDYEKLKGRKCFGALDLSSRRDLSVWGLLFPPDEQNEDFIFICQNYIPEENIEERSRVDGVPYLEWQRNGDIIATPGNVIDYDYIVRDILEAHGLYEIQRLDYDPAFATATVITLAEKGIKINEFTQYYKNFNRAITEIDKLITQGNIVHGGDPVLRWCAGNVTIKRNATGLQMFDKNKSREKIDPMVVLAMCVAGYLKHLEDNDVSKYNDEDIFIFDPNDLEWQDL
jgi:phage terminase large subunit-like protein